MTQEIFGLADKDGIPAVTLGQGEKSVLIRIASCEKRMSPNACRVLAKRLYELARRVEDVK